MLAPAEPRRLPLHLPARGPGRRLPRVPQACNSRGKLKGAQPAPRLRPFPRRFVPAGPRRRFAAEGEDLAAASQNPATKIASLHNFDDANFPKADPPAAAQSTPLAARIMLFASTLPPRFVFGCSKASEPRRGFLAASESFRALIAARARESVTYAFASEGEAIHRLAALPPARLPLAAGARLLAPAHRIC